MQFKRKLFAALAVAVLLFSSSCGAAKGENTASSAVQKASSNAASSSIPTSSETSSASTASSKASPSASSKASSAASAPAASSASSASSEKTEKAKSLSPDPVGSVIREPVITDEMRALSNKSYDTGVNEKNRNEDNVPNGYIYYMNKWGKNYDAKWLMDTSVKELYLTFDEGYETGNTPEILDILKEKGVKATFFITQYFAEKKPELVKRIIAEGHTLGNHTCSHPADGMPSLSLEEQAEDVLTLENEVRRDFGYEMRFFRYPEGTFSDQSLALMNDMGFTCVFWSFSHVDWDVNNQPDPAEALAKMKDRLHPGAIYLLHAVSTTNTEVLDDLIDYAREQGYTMKQF